MKAGLYIADPSTSLAFGALTLVNSRDNQPLTHAAVQNVIQPGNILSQRPPRRIFCFLTKDSLRAWMFQYPTYKFSTEVLRKSPRIILARYCSHNPSQPVEVGILYTSGGILKIQALVSIVST